MYCFTCMPNNRKCYGISKQPYQRFQQHMRPFSCRAAVRQDLALHGTSAFSMQILHSGLTQAQTEALERQCINAAAPPSSLYNVVQEGKPTLNNQVWAIIRSRKRNRAQSQLSAS